MSNIVLRFIHASDFRLDEPLVGIAEAADSLRLSLIDAPFQAATAVFDVALERRVDFVVLTGNLLDPRAAGPRGIAFLVEQFERLDAAGIAVYWFSNEIDAPERWPASIELPANVHHFDAGRGDCLLHWREGQAIAKLGPLAALPLRRPTHTDYAAATDAAEERIFTIGLAHGAAPAVDARTPFDYLALGGQPNRHIAHSGVPWIVQAGSPQGRSIAEAGPHGCTLIEVDSERHVRVALRTSDTVRWREEQLSLDDCHHRTRWEAVLRERVAAVTAEAGDRVVLLRLRLTPGLQPIARTERERLAGELLTWLRETYATAAQNVWTLAVEHEPAAGEPASDATVHEQDTILGEFLRTIDVLRDQPHDGLRLREYAGATVLTNDLLNQLDCATADVRDPLLRHIAELGRELLAGNTAEPSVTNTATAKHFGRMHSAV